MFILEPLQHRRRRPMGQERIVPERRVIRPQPQDNDSVLLALEILLDRRDCRAHFDERLDDGTHPRVGVDMCERGVRKGVGEVTASSDQRGCRSTPPRKQDVAGVDPHALDFDERSLAGNRLDLDERRQGIGPSLHQSLLYGHPAAEHDTVESFMRRSDGGPRRRSPRHRYPHTEDERFGAGQERGVGRPKQRVCEL